ncbi:MAG: HlyD family secretion protein [Marinilabiliales bacterium]|nr:MAG: HlyD family secretion protein [Marinilabiliales bacterium]
MKYLISIFSLLIIITSCNNGDQISDAYGNFEATEIIVSAQANGELMNLNLEEGDVLKTNQIVGLIDSTDLYLRKKLLAQQIQTIKSQLVSIHSEIDVQKQQLENNLISQKRIEKLYSQGAATKKQLDDINGLVDVNKKMIISVNSKKQSILDQIEGVRIQIEQIEESISKCVINNPVRGTVLVKYAEKGELAAMGKPLYKVADVENIKLKVYVSGSQLPKIKLGDEVEVLFDKDKNDNTKTKGKVIWISNTAEFTPKTIQTKEERVNLVYAIKVLVKNDGSIKIGMPGEMDFVK